MEGMISKEAVEIQQAHYNLWQVKKSAGRWAQDLATKLMEATHGQWLYRNVQVHDAVQGEEATKRKEELRDAITRQLDLGAEDLEEDDQHLMEMVLKMDFCLVLMMDHLMEKHLEHQMVYCWVTKMVSKMVMHLDLMMDQHWE